MEKCKQVLEESVRREYQAIKETNSRMNVIDFINQLEDHLKQETDAYFLKLENQALEEYKANLENLQKIQQENS